MISSGPVHAALEARVSMRQSTNRNSGISRCRFIGYPFPRRNAGRNANIQEEAAFFRPESLAVNDIRPSWYVAGPSALLPGSLRMTIDLRDVRRWSHLYMV